jgi:hypothetical protein
MKCEVCRPAYDKALAYVNERLSKSTFAVKMVAGWLYLADGRHEKELKQCIDAAVGWREQRRWRERSHPGNWYPALAAVLLAEYYKYHPEPRVKEAMQKTVDYLVTSQEPANKGWWKWKEGAYKERLDYSVVNHGYITSLVMSFFYTARVHGVGVPDETFNSGKEALARISGRRGIGYGLPRGGGGPWSDKTGARGAWMIQGLGYAGELEHDVWKTYETLLTKRMAYMDQGHHVGAFHCLAMTLGCHMQGPEAYKQLSSYWLGRLMAKQKEDGSVYVGDDGDAGGEVGLLRGHTGSTAAFALLILLQDHNRLIPPSRKRAPDGTITLRVDLEKKREQERREREARELAAARARAKQKQLDNKRAAAEEAGKTWDPRLVERARAATAAGTKVQFTSALMRGKATLRSVNDDGKLLVADHTGSLVLPVPVKRLPLDDRRNIALALVDKSDPDTAALAAFYCFALGDVKKGNELLPSKGDYAKQVREYFKAQGVLK